MSKEWEKFVDKEAEKFREQAYKAAMIRNQKRVRKYSPRKCVSSVQTNQEEKKQ